MLGWWHRGECLPNINKFYDWLSETKVIGVLFLGFTMQICSKS